MGARAKKRDRLAEGIITTYKSHGGRILAAKTMRQDSGAVFNYMVAAFEEPGKQRFELNAEERRCGDLWSRITDPRDYRTKAKDFLDRHSAEVGRALARISHKHW